MHLIDFTKLHMFFNCSRNFRSHAADDLQNIVKQQYDDFQMLHYVTSFHLSRVRSMGMKLVGILYILTTEKRLNLIP